ncbi:MAG: hypothetical protein KGJ09_07070 [Candidatus Omnitrophica bacterium]|nr:hypothetical protein [Candidatus Omnitrophota bacterium]MDE2009826.1 hypothetical protein [Candidatus Omnitrophota bacterium]MDE2214937.1 hypothetical protein [Candidatus Omnitrophota bacterium]MDE2231525.1 hypothetical protein [Candidatus Omnitrophota bacterium]
MGQNDLLYKIRQWDNRAGQWMGRHFYIIFFQIILFIIFILAFIIGLKIIYTGFDVPQNDIVAQLLLVQDYGTILAIMLLILISLGVLNLINHNARLRGTIKNIEYNLSRRRNDQKPREDKDY